MGAKPYDKIQPRASAAHPVGHEHRHGGHEVPLGEDGGEEEAHEHRLQEAGVALRHGHGRPHEERVHLRLCRRAKTNTAWRKVRTRARPYRRPNGSQSSVERRLPPLLPPPASALSPCPFRRETPQPRYHKGEKNISPKQPVDASQRRSRCTHIAVIDDRTYHTDDKQLFLQKKKLQPHTATRELDRCEGHRRVGGN